MRRAVVAAPTVARAATTAPAAAAYIRQRSTASRASSTEWTPSLA